MNGQTDVQTDRGKRKKGNGRRRHFRRKTAVYDNCKKRALTKIRREQEGEISKGEGERERQGEKKENEP